MTHTQDTAPRCTTRVFALKIVAESERMTSREGPERIGAPLPHEVFKTDRYTCHLEKLSSYFNPTPLDRRHAHSDGRPSAAAGTDARDHDRGA